MQLSLWSMPTRTSAVVLLTTLKQAGSVLTQVRPFRSGVASQAVTRSSIMGRMILDANGGDHTSLKFPKMPSIGAGIQAVPLVETWGCGELQLARSS
ncbi:hypothetical protein [Paenibacillus sp. BJ-4]|uniref:hypothetical protein n=1 Tax=Paenibacillus sp. BJ-4 TaxID=2878097 RepID=UPI0039A67047